MAEPPQQPPSGNPEFDKLKETFRRSAQPTGSATLDLIRGVIGRSKALRKPKSIRCSVNKSFHVSYLPYDIAMLSVPVRIKMVNGPTIPELDRDNQSATFNLMQKEFDHFTLCVRDPDEALSKIDDWGDYLKAEADRLLRQHTPEVNGVKFLVINELGFPNYWLGQASGLREGRLRHALGSQSMSLYSRLQELATERNAVIIAGTAHDGATFQNWGPVFFPEADRSTDHKKMTSAYKTGEYIKTAVGSDYPVYALGELTFSILICSDAFDLNIFFEPFATAAANSRLIPNIVFVPSYHHDDRILPGRLHALREACRQLSLATNVIVVFCNHAFDPDRHAVYVGGAQLRLHQDEFSSVATIDGAELSPIRDAARPVWEEMSSTFRKPETVWG